MKNSHEKEERAGSENSLPLIIKSASENGVFVITVILILAWAFIAYLLITQRIAH
jgi:hypothetical protein